MRWAVRSLSPARPATFHDQGQLQVGYGYHSLTAHLAVDAIAVLHDRFGDGRNVLFQQFVAHAGDDHQRGMGNRNVSGACGICGDYWVVRSMNDEHRRLKLLRGQP